MIVTDTASRRYTDAKYSVSSAPPITLTSTEQLPASIQNERSWGSRSKWYTTRRRPRLWLDPGVKIQAAMSTKPEQVLGHFHEWHRFEADAPFTAFAIRIMASTLRSTSSSVVAQLETEILMAVCPCQTVPPHQQVPSD